MSSGVAKQTAPRGWPFLHTDALTVPSLGKGAHSSAFHWPGVALLLPATPLSPLGAMGISQVWPCKHGHPECHWPSSQACVLCRSLHFTLGSRLGCCASDILQLLSITVTVPWLHPSGRQLSVQRSPMAAMSGQAEPRA